jgi:peptide/nickel transport system permease protein
MATYVLRRLLGLIPVLFGISLVVFFLMKLIPGDVAQALLGLTARPEDDRRARPLNVAQHARSEWVGRNY